MQCGPTNWGLLVHVKSHLGMQVVDGFDGCGTGDPRGIGAKACDQHVTR
jgi:hypothetical protein